MNDDTLRFIRTEGSGLLRDTRRELWLNLTGMRAQTRLGGVYASRRDFLEPELFHSCDGYADRDGEEKTRLRLLSSFLALAFLSGKTASVADRILALEAGEEFPACGERMTLRSAKARILSEPRKNKRDEIDEKSGELLFRLNTLCMRKLESLSESSEALGFKTYGELLDETHGMTTPGLASGAEKFLRDTDYIAGDMLEWFLSRKIDVRMKDASLSDITFLFNSAELGGYFPKPDFESFTETVLGGMSLNPPRSASFDTTKRTGKTADGFSLTLGPPIETALSIFPVGGIHDYESLLGCLGHSLCYAFTDPEDDFEFVYPRDPCLTDIFSGLFGGLIYEPEWLKKYLRIDTGGDLHNFLQLRRLMSARIEAGRAVCIQEIYGGSDSGEMSALLTDIMSRAAKCRYDGRKFLPEFLSPVSSPFRFKSLLSLPGLRIFMKESFDEEWWRTPAAGDYLRGVWSEGGRITGGALLERCGCGEQGTEALVRDFEEAFR